MSQSIQNAVSNQDLLKAIQTIDKKLGGLDQKLTDHVEESRKTHEDILVTVNTSFTEMEGSMVTKDDLKHDLAAMETRLVTKDYLDDKLHDLRGDLTILLRKEDTKMVTLISILKDHNVLTPEDVQRVLAMELFPRTTNV